MEKLGKLQQADGEWEAGEAAVAGNGEADWTP